MKPRILRLKCADYVAEEYETTAFWIDANGLLRGWNEFSTPHGHGRNTRGEVERDCDGGWKVRPNDEEHWPGLRALEADLRAQPYEVAS